MSKYRYQYHDDPVVEVAPTRLPAKGKALALIVIALVAAKGTFAANINLTSGGPAEFGQGIQVTAACSGSTALTIKPIVAFANQANSGSYQLTGITVSNIPTSCYGNQFLLNVYDSSTSTSLPLFNSSSKDVVIIDDNGTFYTDGSSDLGIKTNSTSSFTAIFRTPVASAASASKFTIQSSPSSGTYWITSNQVLYLDAGMSSSYSGSGNTFTNLGTLGSSNNGTISNAIYNSNGYFSFGQSRGISYPRAIGDDFTLAVWFRINACGVGAPGGGSQAFDSGDGQLLSGSFGGAANDWDMSLYNCYLGLQTGSSGGGEETTWATSAVTPNVWHYAVAARTKATGRTDLYVDGTLVGTRVTSGLTNNKSLTAQPTQGIGYDTDWGSYNRYFNGDIAVVQEYNSILTQSQIQINYNALRARYGN